MKVFELEISSSGGMTHIAAAAAAVAVIVFVLQQ